MKFMTYVMGKQANMVVKALKSHATRYYSEEALNESWNDRNSQNGQTVHR